MPDTVVDRSVDEVTDRAKRTRAESSTGQWRPLLVRMHFYAGVLVAPFVFIACLTGLLFVFAPQIDRMTHAQLLVVDQPGKAPLSVNQQVASAVAAEPGLNLTSVVPNQRPDETTRVNFIKPGAPPMTTHTVFVNPYTGQVQGIKDVSMHGGYLPFSAWVVGLHGDLGLGEFGRWYSELASLWIVVLTIGGIIMWWQRCAVHRKATSGAFWKKLLIVERGRRPGVRRTMSWHSTIGVWTAVLALLFGLTGLPFARTSGPKWLSAVGASNMHLGKATLDTTLPPPVGVDPKSGHFMPDGSWMSNADMTSGQPSTGSGQGSGAPQGSGGHGGNGGNGGNGGHRGTGSGFAGAAKADFDLMAKNAAVVGVDQKVRFTAPTRPGTGWTVGENKQEWPVAADSALVDPKTFAVVRTFDWDTSATPVDKLNKWILLFHFGRLFGFVGQIIFGLAMLGVLWISWWGYKMWWQRRPRGSAWRFGKVPVRGAWRKAPKVSLVSWTALTLVTFWIFPVLGVSTLAFVLLDVGLGLIQAMRKAPAATAG